MNRNETTNSTQHLQGVACDVSNCVHHNGQCCCTAQEIKVGPQYANTSTDTVCATFQPRG